jgi:hypothetical protein
MWGRLGSKFGLDASAKERHVPLVEIKPRLIDTPAHYLAFVLTTLSPENHETLPFEVKSEFYARASFVMHCRFVKYVLVSK